MNRTAQKLFFGTKAFRVGCCRPLCFPVCRSLGEGSTGWNMPEPMVISHVSVFKSSPWSGSSSCIQSFSMPWLILFPLEQFERIPSFEIVFFFFKGTFIENFLITEVVHTNLKKSKHSDKKKVKIKNHLCITQDIFLVKCKVNYSYWFLLFV